MKQTRYVYIAAPLGQREAACSAAIAISRYGLTIASNWHWTTDTVDPSAHVDRKAILRANMIDMDLGEVFLVLADKGLPRATFVELGFALAKRKPVVWLQGPDGQGGNIFDAHPSVTIVRSIYDAVREVCTAAYMRTQHEF